MKIAEALSQRAYLNQRLAQLTGRMQASAQVQEGDKPPEVAEALLDECMVVIEQIEGLTVEINSANNRAKIESGETIMAAIAMRESLQRSLSTHKALVQAAERYDRWGREEIRRVPTVDVKKLNDTIDKLAEDRRKLDIAIQGANWKNDL